MKYVVLLMILLLFPVVAYPDVGFWWGEAFRPTDYDARARALGRTGIVNTTGSGAIFYNPANIGMLDGITFQAGGRVRMGSVDDDDYYNELEDTDWEGKYQLHPKITNASFAMPFDLPSAENVGLAFGIGYNTYYDYGLKTREEYSFSNSNKVTTTTDATRKGGLNTISPAIAVTFNDQYSVGLAYHKSIMKKVETTSETDVDPEPSYLYYTIERENKAEISGSFVTLGGAAKPIPELMLGFMYRSGFEVEIEDQKWKRKSSDGDVTNGKSDDEEWEIPAIFGLGVSYQVTPEVLLAAEYQNRPFSDIEWDGDDFDIDDGACYRVGAEFQSSVLLRVGAFSDAIFVTDEDDDSPRTLNGITAGIGFVAENVSIDFFGEYSFWSCEYEETVGGNKRNFDYKETHFMFGGSITITLEQ